MRVLVVLVFLALANASQTKFLPGVCHDDEVTCPDPGGSHCGGSVWCCPDDDYDDSPCDPYPWDVNYACRCTSNGKKEISTEAAWTQ